MACISYFQIYCVIAYYHRLPLSGKKEDNLKGLFERRPSTLAALDGVRALAILWVLSMHAWTFWPLFLDCKLHNSLLMQQIVNGDLGVDMFFVLSGFLISWILLKECKKYDGNVDIFNFYRSRFLRLWPALLALECL